MNLFIELINVENFVSGLEVKASLMEPLSAGSGRKMIIVNENADSKLVLSYFLFARSTARPGWLGILDADVLDRVSDAVVFEQH